MKNTSSQPMIAARHPFVEDWRPAVVPLESVAHPQAASDLALLSGAGAAADDPAAEFALAVARGLSDIPRRLDSRFLYDEYGSFIFERICEQPEYYLTRTEATILASAAADIARRTGELTLVELGSGNSVKTRLLLEAYAKRHGSACYTPVDISKSILQQAEQEIAALYPTVKVEAMHGTYDDAFPLLPALSPALLLFLGSTVGNLDAHEASRFWDKTTSHLLSGDYCLLGVDINEDSLSLNAAYNDAAGFSAAFTRNMFARMNRELGAALDVTSIDHVARYAPRWRRVEIFGRFRRAQRIVIAPTGSAFRIGEGEMILTEVSRKFHLRQLVPYLCTFGLNTEQIYSDRNRRFAVLLLRKL